MKLSVLLTVYEHDNDVHFSSALKSIWDNQTVRPNEIVLVVDGPVSILIENVISNFKKRCSCLILLRNGKNLGLSRSLQRGLEASKGRFIARMDADDISEPNRFERMLKFFDENPNVDVLGGNIRIFGPSISKIRTYPSNHVSIRRYIRFASPHAHPSVMFKRKSILKCGGYSKDLRTTQDLELWFRSLAEGNIHANLPEVLLNFRVETDFWNRRARDKAIIELKIYQIGYKLLNIPKVYFVFCYLRFIVRSNKTFSKVIYKLLR